MFEPKLTLKTAPSVEPVLLQALVDWTGASASDPLLTTMLVSARERVEGYLGAGLITQTWQQFYNLSTMQEDWWDGVQEGATTELVRLPRGFQFGKWPLNAVVSLNFYDEADVAFLADPLTYYVDATSRPPQVALRRGFIWPSPVYRVRDAVILECTVGYGAAGSAVPEAIKNAIKALAAFMYEHRGDCDGDEALRKSGAIGYLQPFKVMKT